MAREKSRAIFFTPKAVSHKVTKGTKKIFLNAETLRWRER